MEHLWTMGTADSKGLTDKIRLYIQSVHHKIVVLLPERLRKNLHEVEFLQGDLKEMIFEWDENKAQNVLQTRSIDFNDMIPIFFDVRTERTSNTHNEMRWVTVGRVKGDFFRSGLYKARGSHTYHYRTSSEEK